MLAYADVPSGADNACVAVLPRLAVAHSDFQVGVRNFIIVLILRVIDLAV